MGFILKLKHGSKHIDLNDGSTYWATSGWAPPAPIMDTQFASGNRANTYGGGTVIDRQYLDNVANVPLNIVGNFAAETHLAARRLVSFLNSALADQSETLYLVYNADDSIPYEPLWGQHHHYYEIKDATAALRRLSDYLTTEVRTEVIFLTLPFTTAPLPNGLSQCVGSATGGIQEHSYATRDKLSRGTFIPRAVTNLHTNPAFGHGTYDTGWSVGASTVKSENKDREFIFCGETSCKVTNQDTAAPHSISQTVTLAAVTHVESLYVKLPNGGTIDSTVARVFYNGSPVDSDYWYIGDGWYRVSAQITGTAAAAALGMWINAAYTLYLGGVQCEANTTYATPLAVGDMLDHAWSGTAHNSTSTRPAGRLRYPFANLIEEGGFSIYVCVMPYHNHDDSPTTLRIFRDSDSDIALIYDTASTSWRFTDGTTVVTYTDTFNAGDVRHIHIVCTPADGIAIYVNGDTDGGSTNSTFTPSTAATYLYIGSTAVPNEHANCTYLDFITWREGLTAAEVLAHYNNKNSAAADADGVGARLGCLPWLWTDDGDDTVDNCYDSTRENWFVCGGIPGNVQAKTDWRIKYGTDWYSAAFSWFGSIQRLTYNALAGGTDLQSQYYDYNATATTVADSGSSVFTGTVGTTEFDFGTPLSTVAVSLHIDEMFGSNYHLYFRLSDAGSDLQARIHIYGGSDGAIDYASEWETVAADSTMRGFCIGPIYIDRERLDGLLDIPERYQVALALKRTTGSADVTADFAIAMPSPWVYVRDRSAVVDTALSIDCIMTGGKAALVQDGTSNLHATTTVEKDGDFDLFPNAANLIYSAMGDGQYAMTVTLTAQFEINVTPRWALL